MNEAKKRFVISLNSEMEALVEHIRSQMQNNLPEHLKTLKVSKSLAVETAIKQYHARMEEA